MIAVVTLVVGVATGWFAALAWGGEAGTAEFAEGSVGSAILMRGGGLV